MKRRDFLQTTGAVIVGFVMDLTLGELGMAQDGSLPAPGKPVDPKQVDSFIAIHSDGSVSIYTSKVDVGTGLRIAISQMVAEELGVPVEKITVVEGDTAITPDHGGTGGSTGIPRGGTDLRQAAATARQAIEKLRAEKPGASLGELIGGKRLMVEVDPKAPLKNPAQYTIVGKPILRPDVPAKTTGRFTYVQDFSVPGMLHARVLRPKSYGSKLMSVDEASIRNIPNARVVRLGSFLAVVANDEWAAIRASRELKVTWTDWRGLPGSDRLEEYVRNGAVERDEAVVSKGDAPSALSTGTKQLQASYFWPYQSHASLGPACAVADVRPDGTTIWTSSQGPHGMRTNFAKLFGIPDSQLRVVYLDGSGSYGTNGGDDAAADAFLLSKTLGKPVRVQWMREDELAWDPKGPPQALDLRGAVDAAGKIVAWDTQMWLPANVPGGRPLLAADGAGIQQPQGRGAGQVTNNGDPPYAAANVRVLVHWLKDSPLRLSNLRAPGKIANAFAVESFTDELASAAGIDSVEFRLRGLTDPRAIDVIKRAAEMIGWKPRPSPNPDAAQGRFVTGRGLAYVRYKQAENYVAIAMDVAVDSTTGKVNVRRVTCAHDCGLVINPDGLKNQIEGCIVQTLGRTLHEEVKFDTSRVTSVSWASYPILTFPEAPAVEVALIDRPNLPPLGAGEAATAPVAAALGNAIFDATGVRVRTVPIRTVTLARS